MIVIVLAASVIAFLAPPPWARADATSELATTLQQSRDAIGAKALQRGGVLLTEGVADVSGLNGTGSSAAEIGGARLAERTSTPPIAAGDGYDGANFWNQDQSGLVWTDGSDAGVSQEIDNAYAAGDTLFVPGSGGATIVWDGIRRVDGRKYLTLSVTPRRSLVPMQVWIDAASHFPVRYVKRIGAVSSEIRASNYRRVDGLWVPFRVVSQSSDGNSSDIKVTTARIVRSNEAALVKPRSHVNDFSIIDAGKRTSVPFDLIDNHIYLSAMLNGKGPYRFVFDTGGSNVIDPAVAKEINAEGSGSAQDAGTGAGTESYSYATINSLRIGSAELRHQIFSVEPISRGFGMTAGERVDGLIGFEVLARYFTTFDYLNRRLTLAMPGSPTSSDAKTLHFVFFGTIPQIGCAIDGISAECTVDTGEGGAVALFVPFIGDHPQIIPTVHSAVGVNGYGVGGGHRGFVGRLGSLQVGSFTARNLVAGFSSQEQGVYAFPFLAANLGGGLWRAFTVAFDYRDQTMSLRATAPINDPGYDRSGLLLINRAGKVVVYDVRAGTPAAEAGLAKGDVIFSIDGVPTQTLEQCRRILRGAPNSVLHVRIIDGTGASRTVAMTLRDWV